MKSDAAEYIASAVKKTPAKAYIRLKDSRHTQEGLADFILFGDWDELKEVISAKQEEIAFCKTEVPYRNSAVGLLDTRELNVRVEPGAIIREQVILHDKAVIMMGAVVNIGAEIGAETMIDMNAVIGANAIIQNQCHIGAGAVVAGVLEPPSAKEVIIEDRVLVGANAVILEGIRVGHDAVVAAGAIVTQDVEPFAVVAGNPASFIKWKDEKTAAKTQFNPKLRNF